MNPRPLLTEIPWETRNLGVPSFSLDTDAAKGLGAAGLNRALEAAADEYGPFFAQVKIGQAQRELALIIGSVGFYFMETTLTPHMNLQSSEVLDQFDQDPSLFLRGPFTEDQLQFGLLDRSDNARCDAIREIAVSSFKMDRFRLDPNCKAEVARRRYHLWVDQMLADETCQFDILTHDKEVVAFLVLRDTRWLISGIAQAYTRKGLGSYFWLSTLSQMRKRNLPEIISAISTNNTDSMNLHVKLGFRFRDPTAVFHYWSEHKAEGLV